MSKQPDICDMCGKKITDSDAYNQWRVLANDNSGNLSTFDWDFCPTCFDKIEEFIEKNKKK